MYLWVHSNLVPECPAFIIISPFLHVSRFTSSIKTYRFFYYSQVIKGCKKKTLLLFRLNMLFFSNSFKLEKKIPVTINVNF